MLQNLKREDILFGHKKRNVKKEHMDSAYNPMNLMNLKNINFVKK